MERKMNRIDVRDIEHRCALARASLKRIGTAHNDLCEPGEALQNANFNSECFRNEITKQARELRAAKEETALRLNKLKDLKTELAGLRERKSKLSEAINKEKREKKVSETERSLQSKRSVLREKVDVLNRKLEDAAALKSTVSQSKSLEDTTRQVELFTHRLGLRVSKMPGDRLRVSMRYIDQKDPDRECSFTVSISEDGIEYGVDDVQPSIRGLPEMIKELNETGDFSYFCRAMRRRFRDTSQ